MTRAFVVIELDMPSLTPIRSLAQVFQACDDIPFQRGVHLVSHEHHMEAIRAFFPTSANDVKVKYSRRKKR